MPNLPLVYWQEKKKKKVPKNYTGCTKFPDMFDLHFNNKYWQLKETKNGTFYLYAAFYDVRKAQSRGCLIIIIGSDGDMIERRKFHNLFL